MAVQYTKLPQNRPKGQKIYQHLLGQDPPRLTQIRIFGLKVYHLATMNGITDPVGRKKNLPDSTQATYSCAPTWNKEPLKSC
jgi:hypothetical protein